MEGVARVLGLGVLVALQTSCAGAEKEVYTPVQEKTKLEESTLLQASVRALEEMDYEIGLEDTDAYMVRSRMHEVSVSSIPKLSYRYYFTIKTAEGTLRISVSCEENSALDKKKFETCGDEAPSQIVEDQRQLHDKIIVIAKEWTH
jgi:hypothetical protein